MTKTVPKSKPKYVSCIKITGVPIIPPLMTPQKRKEMQIFRQQAIKLEKRMQRERELRKQIEQYYNSEVDVPNLPQNTTLEHQLTFAETEPYNVSLSVAVPSDIHELPKLHSFEDFNFVIAETEKQVCDSAVVNRNMEMQNITSDSESLADGESENLTMIDMSKSSISIQSPRPKLIRSNSYTLDAPSPILLAHLREQANKQMLNTYHAINFENCINSNTVEDLNLHNISKLTLFEHESAPYICSNIDLPRQSMASVPYTNESPEEAFQKSPYFKHTLHETPGIQEVIENNFTAQEPDQSVDVVSKLIQILGNSPESYPKEIKELFGDENMDSGKRIQKLVDLRNYLQNTSMKEIELKSIQSADAFTTVQSPSNLSFMTSSQTLYFSVNSSNETLNSGSPNMNDMQVERNPLNCNRELFPEVESTHNRREMWAASKIGAAVKGYLVRRLLRTDKVQELIQTLKDALICAMELHQVEDIQPSDVELHRRLIQQVSAACYAFHDVFFGTSIPAQMGIISQDRQRQLDKLKRPTSTLSSRVSSNRNTPRSRTSSGCKKSLKASV